jgi:hypothetical protein
MLDTSVSLLSIVIPVVITLGINIVNYLPVSLALIPLQAFKIHMYTLTDTEICIRIQKRILYSTNKTDDNQAYGYAIGKWYFINLFREYGEWKVHMLATEATYKALIAPSTETDEKIKLDYCSPLENSDSSTSITLLQRAGSYSNVYYRKRNVNLGLLDPLPQQQTILELIQKNQEKFGYTTAFLHGPPGTGKSMISYILAQRSRGTFCNTLKPWQPGDCIEELYGYASPTKGNPLIILFDEIDINLKRIHEQSILPHKSIPTAIMDKSGWNRFLDNIQLGIYPNIILILTSNKSPQEIDALDPSYLRAHRVDFVFHLKEIIQD